MFKKKKTIISLVVIAILVMSLGTTAFAGHSKARIYQTAGQVWGSADELSGYVSSRGYNSASSDSEHITAYSYYNSGYQHPKTLVKGAGTQRWGYTVPNDTTVSAVLEAIWGDSNTGEHYLADADG